MYNNPSPGSRVVLAPVDSLEFQMRRVLPWKPKVHDFPHLFIHTSSGLLGDTPRSNRRGLPQSASQVAIAAAQADKLSKSSQSANNQSSSKQQSSESTRLSLQLDEIGQYEDPESATPSTQQHKAALLSPSVNNMTSPRRQGGARKQPLPQIQRIMSSSLQAALAPPQAPGTNNGTGSQSVAGPPTLSRGMSARATVEASRQALMEMMSQIRSVDAEIIISLLLTIVPREYDPYPCILGIPIMPALFLTCKFYIFISFMLLGTRMMIIIFKTF